VVWIFLKNERIKKNLIFRPFFEKNSSGIVHLYVIDDKKNIYFEM